MRIWRSHPVLFAALLGALVGFGDTLAVEVPALLGRPSKGVLSMLEPASRLHPGGGVPQTAFLLFIEIAANVLVHAGMFAILGGLYLLIRRAFRGASRSN